MESAKQEKKQAVGFKLTSTAKDLLSKRAAIASMNHSEYIEFLIRKDAGLPLKDEPPAKPIKTSSQTKHCPAKDTPKTKSNRPKFHEDFLFQVGKTLAARRLQLGMSQEKLALLAGLHRTYITEIEKGKRNLTLYCLMRLSAALQISANSICRNAEANIENEN